MESIYWVACWACHRKCRHCYEARFRPYVREALEAVVAEAERNSRLVLENLPPRLTWRDTPAEDGTRPERPARVILAGGEALLDRVRQRVTYPVLEGLRARYAGQGGVKVVVQTTGDLLTPAIVEELLARGVWMISVAGLDDLHVGMEGAARQEAWRQRLSAMMQAAGMRPAGIAVQNRKALEEEGPVFSFFGATPESWIGKLWPRGRAWENGLSTATLEDNFCNRWSGGLNFLRHGEAGAEVSIEPDGSVYPCCLKTRMPLGNLTEEPLLEILDSLRDDPAYAAISRGEPEQMGLADGWTKEDFIAKSHTLTPQGRPYANLCIGCDRFHEEVLAERVAAARAARQARRAVVA